MRTLTDMCNYHKNILEASTKALLSATVKETVNMAMDKKKTSELVSMLTETMAQSYTSGEMPDHTELIAVAVMDVLNRASSIAESTIEKKHGRQAKKADNEG